MYTILFIPGMHHMGMHHMIWNNNTFNHHTNTYKHMSVSRVFPYEKIGFGAPFATFLMKTYGFEQSSCFSYENIRFEAFVFKLAKGGFGVRKQTRNRLIYSLRCSICYFAFQLFSYDFLLVILYYAVWFRMGSFTASWPVSGCSSL